MLSSSSVSTLDRAYYHANTLHTETPYIIPSPFIPESSIMNEVYWVNPTQNKKNEIFFKRQEYSDTETIVDCTMLNLGFSMFLHMANSCNTSYNEMSTNDFGDNWWGIINRKLKMDQYKTREISWNGLTFLLSSEIVGNIQIEDDYYVFNYSPLNIEVYSKSRDEVEDYFSEEFAMLWHEYAEEDDNNLTHEAITLKHKMKMLVSEVRIDGSYKN